MPRVLHEIAALCPCHSSDTPCLPPALLARILSTNALPCVWASRLFYPTARSCRSATRFRLNPAGMNNTGATGRKGTRERDTRASSSRLPFRSLPRLNSLASFRACISRLLSYGALPSSRFRATSGEDGRTFVAGSTARRCATFPSHSNDRRERSLCSVSSRAPRRLCALHRGVFAR